MRSLRRISGPIRLRPEPESDMLVGHPQRFVSEASIAELFRAMGLLMQLYRGRDVVPKSVALALVDVSGQM